jgi:hypothetical protein
LITAAVTACPHGTMTDSIMIGRLRRIGYTDVIAYLDRTAAREHRR